MKGSRTPKWLSQFLSGQSDFSRSSYWLNYLSATFLDEFREKSALFLYRHLKFSIPGLSQNLPAIWGAQPPQEWKCGEARKLFLLGYSFLCDTRKGLQSFPLMDCRRRLRKIRLHSLSAAAVAEAEAPRSPNRPREGREPCRLCVPFSKSGNNRVHA